MVLQEESTFKTAEEKDLTFINQRAPWKIAVATAGVIIAAGSFFIYDGFKGNWLYIIGMIMMFANIIFPLKFKNYVRYQKNFVHVKLDKQRAKTFRPSQIKNIEVLKDKIYIWKTKKKKEVLKIDQYSEHAVNQLVDLLQGEKLGLRQS